MAKRYIPKALSVGLSLALCASLVAPAFAANFGQLQAVIDNGVDVTEGDIIRTGNTITLIRDVTREENETGIEVTGTVTIDLNGKTISGKTDGGTYLNGAVINVANGGDLTIQDSSDEKKGTITGGKNTNTTDAGGGGGGVRVVAGGKFTLNSGAISGNTVGGPGGGGVYVTGGEFIMNGGVISNNNTINGGWGGGVNVVFGGKFTLNSGKISNNTAKNGGGVTVETADTNLETAKKTTFIMNGGEISGNTASVNGGGVWISKNIANFEVNGGKISGNTAMASGGGVGMNSGSSNKNDVKPSFTMNDGEISDNYAANADVANVWFGDGNHSETQCLDTTNGYKANHSYNEGVVTTEPTSDTAGVRTYTCLNPNCGWTKTEAIPALAKEPETSTDEPTASVETEVPETPAVVTVDPVIGIDEPVVAIDDPAVPLAAGPATCGEFIDYLWRHEGEPEVDSSSVDHEYAPAIAWAQSIDILPDGMDFDELITVSMVRDILTNFAAWADMVMPELTSLTGEEDEAVLNCDEVLAEFFGEELAG